MHGREAMEDQRRYDAVVTYVRAHGLETETPVSKVFNRSSGSRVAEWGTSRASESGGSRVSESDAARVNMPERAARVNMSENGSSSDELDDRWQRILEQQARAQQERKTGERRRASRRADEKMPSYKLPEMVVVQDGGGGRRRLG